jgi:polar amino acid transport system substrate-binding protein
MTRPRLTRVLPLLLSGLLATGGSACAAELRNNPPSPLMSIAICDDENEWPPASYFVRRGGVRTEAMAGYALDVLDEIFTRLNIRYSVTLIPWPRCVAVATKGEQYQMILNFSYNAERLKQFYFSRAYYATTTYYYYSRKNNPQGLAIHGAADLRKYRACGVQGFNYTGYGFGPHEVDQGTKDFTSLIAKVKLGRCALFVEKDEIMVAFAKIGKNYLADPDLAKAPVPGMKPTRFYFGISRNFARAAELHTLIDDQLLLMEESGRLVELWKKASATTVAR